MVKQSTIFFRKNGSKIKAVKREHVVTWCPRCSLKSKEKMPRQSTIIGTNTVTSTMAIMIPKSNTGAAKLRKTTNVPSPKNRKEARETAAMIMTPNNQRYDEQKQKCDFGPRSGWKEALNYCTTNPPTKRVGSTHLCTQDDQTHTR